MIENPSATPSRTPLVSIIVNNYNYGRFLWEAIDSALGQTYSHREVIVVDDGSTDNSREVIAGYRELIIPVLKENGGQASAFNAGFAASAGELILFLDSDDMLEPNAIETAVRDCRDGLGMVFFPLRTVDANGHPRGGLVGGTLSPGPLRGPFCFGSPTSGNVFSRTVLEKILPMPTEGWRISADFYLTGAASLCGGARRLERPLGMYRVHGRNNEACAEETSSFRSRINLDLRLYDGLSRLMDGRMATLENWLGTCPQHWVRRIKLLRERPDDYPWTDSLASLTARAAKACWREPNRTIQQRLAYTAFVITYGLLPRTAIAGARKLLRWLDGEHPGRTYRGVLGT